MSATVQKWGNSLGLRLPKAIAEQVHLKLGTKVKFDTTNGVLTVVPARPVRRRRRSKYTFKELWGSYKGPSPHRSLDRDPPVGKELL